MAKVQNITGADFEGSTLLRQGFIILECYNNFSSPLQIMEPVFTKIKDKGKINFEHLRINTIENQQIIETFRLMKEPSYLFFIGGILVERADGLVSYNRLMKIMSALLLNYPAIKQMKGPDTSCYSF